MSVMTKKTKEVMGNDKGLNDKRMTVIHGKKGSAGHKYMKSESDHYPEK